jgi:hypothetical protein
MSGTPSIKSPAGVPPSGSNAKYGIIALFLAIGLGVALYFMLKKSDSVAQVIPPLPSASGASEVNPRVDDVPPPPPLEVKPDAGGPNVKYVYVPGGGCEGKCAGTSPPDLAGALQMRASAARQCYNKALAQDPSLKGDVTIAVRVGPAGNVCSANVSANNMGTQAVAQCAANVFRSSAGFPAPKGGCVDATVPMHFVSQNPGP